ncbi:MAG: HlyD family efflux transporter periplasmic adaptor subunit [Magnetococcales bacterium]|nr:HlyD family efflux transporter periplasmic adaptor subunit [Magnetococcales bacterium]
MSVTQAATILLDLSRRARQASSQEELHFLLVNGSHELTPYRQAVLWSNVKGVQALSGVVQMEANAPYVHWLTVLCHSLSSGGQQPRLCCARDMPDAVASAWDEWLPEYGVWLPLARSTTEVAPCVGALLLVREVSWQDYELLLLTEWLEIWRHACHARVMNEQRFSGQIVRWLRDRISRKATATIGIAVIVGLAWLPVPMSVLAPGELVPANPSVIRAPLEGVIEHFFVQPNATVQSGSPLFLLDQSTLRSRLEIATQAMITAEAEYRQSAQLAVSETRSKGLLAPLTGKIEERKAEVDYLRDQLERCRVVAPHDGLALFDDPHEWIGRPVTVGERVMRVAMMDDVEVEAWLGVGDAIPLASDRVMSLHLNATPLDPVPFTIRYVAHDAVQRPDGSYAYRVRARLVEPTRHRVGLKGTARLTGEQVTIGYWIMRRPWAVIRQMLGW